MTYFLKLAAASLLVSSATYVMAQQNDQTRPAQPMPETSPNTPTQQSPNAARAPSQEGIGSRPIGPPSASGTAAADNDKNTTDLKK